MNSDRDKTYMKIVAFDDICNFVVQFFHLKSSCGKKNDTHPYLNFQYLELGSISFFKPLDDYKWKNLNYKVIDFVESYNFYIKFIFIRVHKKITIFWKRIEPYRRAVRWLEML
jgi:hypothetical protein